MEAQDAEATGVQPHSLAYSLVSIGSCDGCWSSLATRPVKLTAYPGPRIEESRSAARIPESESTASESTASGKMPTSPLSAEERLSWVPFAMP